MKNPRGAKLDAAKEAEYRAAIREPWQTSTWERWTITGRVLPERCDVYVQRGRSRLVFAAGRVETDLQVDRGHAVVNCTVEQPDPSVSELADIARSALTFPIDYLAVRNRAAYELVLDLCIKHTTGQSWPIPVAEPIFDQEREGLCFDPRTDNAPIAIPFEAASLGPELPTALHDLTEAVRYPRRTFEHCRMAVEAVRRHFDPQEIRGLAYRHVAGEKALCTALKVTRRSLLNLDRVAARSRHGELIVSINWPMRKRAMELAWEIVARFAEHLQRRPSEAWQLLDIQVET
jgi:hypothetical protein